MADGSRNMRLHPRRVLDTTSFAGAIKARCWDLDMTLKGLAPQLGMQPGTLRARLSKCRGKRALQPWQVSKLAELLKLDRKALHQLAAKHEGWDV